MSCLAECAAHTYAWAHTLLTVKYTESVTAACVCVCVCVCVGVEVVVWVQVCEVSSKKPTVINITAVHSACT